LTPQHLQDGREIPAAVAEAVEHLEQGLGLGTQRGRGTDLGRRVLSRPFAANEREALLGFLSTQRQRLAAGELDAAKLGGDGGGDPVDRAAWMLVARAVMNLDETVVKR
jgi:hypothetical protein